MKTKRILHHAVSTLLLCALCGLTLAACGGSDSNSNSDTSTTAGTDTSTSTDTTLDTSNSGQEPSDMSLVNDLVGPTPDTSVSTDVTVTSDVVINTDAVVSADIIQQPPLLVCQNQTFSSWVTRIHELAIDTSTDGVVTDTASGQTYYNVLIPVLGKLNYTAALDTANNALADALQGTVNGQSSNLGPTSILIEMKTNADPVTEQTQAFSSAVYGAYIEGATGLGSINCAYHMSSVGDKPTCNYEVDIFSFDTSTNQCKARFEIAPTPLQTTQTQGRYLFRSTEQSQPVELILPIIGGAPLAMDIHQVAIDTHVEFSHTINQNTVKGAFFAKNDTVQGLISGVICADKLGELVSRFGLLQGVDLGLLIPAVAKDVLEDPKFKVEDDPCVKDGRNSLGLRIVLRFRGVPGKITKIIASPTQTP